MMEFSFEGIKPYGYPQGFIVDLENNDRRVI